MPRQNRLNAQLRPIIFTANVNRYAEGSCLVECGHTKVLCTASVEENVPPFLKRTGKGWVTAEYGMLPRSTHTRMPREAAKGKQSGRTLEIQRLIGRSLRAIINMDGLGERQITIDCDVLHADGGTRTASINGAYIALYLACKSIGKERLITDSVAAISCGIYEGQPLLDLDYEEDSNAEADANFVLTGNGNIIEVQGTAEKKPFSEAQLLELLSLARQGIATITDLQKQALAC